MFTHNFLNQIEEALFQSYFMKGIDELYAKRFEEGDYSVEAADYSKARAVLERALSSEKNELLRKYETICKEIGEYYVRHGFVAGIYAGFRHCFTIARDIDAGYDRYVMNEIMTQPNMQRHVEIYKTISLRNEIYNKLAEECVENCDSPIVCISCYWDEVASGKGELAFYCGYRAANAIADRFGLMETDYMQRMVKTLSLEHTFHYIETVAEMERRLERQQNCTRNNGEETTSIQ